MALGISAVLLTGADPRPVQVQVTGLTVGQAFTVTGGAAGWAWTVQGADAVLAGATQAVLVDVQAPLNTLAAYTVVQGASSATSATLEVPFTAGDAAVMSLDGETVAAIGWVDNGDPRDGAPRQDFFTPAGRERPVMHYDVEATETGTIVAETSGADTTALLALARAGAPVVVRTDVGVRDLDPVQVVAITAYPRQLVGAVGTLRRWDLTVTLVDDTDDETPLAMATVADFNDAGTGQTVADFNAAWAGQTVADFNAYDWGA